MFANLTRGGQIQMHQFRMLKQIFKVGFSAAFWIMVLVFSWKTYNNWGSYRFNDAATYIEAQLRYNYEPHEKLEKFWRPNKPRKWEMIRWPKTPGKQSSMVKYVARDGYIKKSFNYIIDDITDNLQSSLLWGIGTVISLFVAWFFYGRYKGRPDQTKGAKIHTPREVRKYLKNKSDFVVDGMPLVKDKETSHILVTGTTGSGKSNCMHSLLPQIRDKNQTAIIVDFTGEMVARYYDKKRGDIIVNPFDDRGADWDFWKEAETVSGLDVNLKIIANSLFTRNTVEDNEFWTESASVLFQDCVRKCEEAGKKQISHLNELMAKVKMSVLADKLQGTYSEAYLDKNNEKTATSIRSTLATYTVPLRELNDEGNFTFKEFIADNKNKGRWLFLTSTPETRDIMKPLISMWMDLIVNKVMALGPDYNRRMWLVIDELPALKKIPSMPTALAEFRKYGGCILAGMQSANQLYKLYGQKDGLTMLDQFNTKFIFRTEETTFVNYICKNFGDKEYSEIQENLSYGAHEMRDGVSVAKIEKIRPLLTAADLAGLADLEAYVKLPSQEARCCHLKMKYHDSASTTPAFVSRPERVYKEKLAQEKKLNKITADLAARKYSLNYICEPAAKSTTTYLLIKDFALKHELGFHYEELEKSYVKKRYGTKNLPILAIEGEYYQPSIIVQGEITKEVIEEHLLKNADKLLFKGEDERKVEEFRDKIALSIKTGEVPEELHPVVKYVIEQGIKKKEKV